MFTEEQQNEIEFFCATNPVAILEDATINEERHNQKCLEVGGFQFDHLL